MRDKIMEYVKATAQNLNKFDIVNITYGDKPAIKLAVVENVTSDGVTVRKLYDDKNHVQTYKFSSLRKLVSNGVDLIKYVSVVSKM